MSPATAAREFVKRYYDFGRGVIGGLTDFRREPNWLKFVDNLVGRPKGCMGEVRDGYREIQASSFDDAPTSMAKLVVSAGNRLLVHTVDTLSPGSGKLYSIQPSVPGRTLLTPPFSISDGDVNPRQLNAALFIPQIGGSNVPLMYHVDGGVYRLDTTVLRPPTGITPTVTAAGTTGGVDPGYHWWRLRYRYRNGTSLPTAAFPTGGKNVVAASEKMDLTGLDDDATALAAQDYQGWTLERTTLSTVTNALYTGSLGSTAVPDARAQWFWVADGTGDAYSDIIRDADLFYRIDPGIYDSPPHLEGVVPYRNRLVGWYGHHLLVSQAVGDEFGTGPCNFDAELDYLIGEDTDDIQSVVLQGDRLVCIKSRTVHPFEGFSPDDFRTYQLPSTGGAVGPRAVCVHGATVYMLGETGLLRMRGNTVEPWGEIEVGHYLDTMNPSTAVRAKVKAFVVAGEYISFAYPGAQSSYNDEEIIYDLQTQEFRHFKGRRIRDAVVQEDNSEDFDGATLLTLDPAVTAPPSDVTVLNPSFIAWHDSRVATQQFYVQKESNDGVDQWTSGGVLASANTSGSQSDAVDICTDGGSGVIVATIENRGSGVGLYAQHLDSAGAPQWSGGTGVLVGLGPFGTTPSPRMCADGLGGAYIIVTGNASPVSHKMYRIDSAGAVVSGWPITLVAFGEYGNAARPQVDPASGDVLIAVPADDTADGTGNGADVFVNRISPAGVKAWGSNGVKVGKDDSFYARGQGPCFAPDGTGGMVVAQRNSTSSILVKRYNSVGTLAWTSGNMAAGTTPVYHAAVSDGAGGLIVAWSDSIGPSVRANRVNAVGSLPWAGPTILQVVSQFNAWDIVGVPDGVGGAIFAWSAAATTAYDIQAARINASGGTVWSSGFVTVASQAGGQIEVQICTDGANGAVLAWTNVSEVYAARLLAVEGGAVWTAGGNLISTAAGTQRLPRVVFTGTPGDSTPASGRSVYRVWAHPVGARDEVLADGTGGRPIATAVETPFLDGGMPDVVKEILRLQLDAEGDDVELTATLTVDPGDGSGEIVLSAPLTIESSGTIVGDESGSIGPTDGQVANEDGSASGITGLDVVGGDSTLRPFTGLGGELFGKRFKLSVRADTDGDYRLNGFTVDGNLMPKREFS